MRQQLVLALATLAIGIVFTTACGGGVKPPMVPDDPSVGDASADMPTAAPPAPLAPPTVK